MLFEVLLSLAGFGQGFGLVGIPSRTVPVCGTKMTNLVFPVALETGVKVSKDILVQRPKGVENVIQLKAVRRNFPATNLSVFGKDGRLYSFDLRYVDDTAVLSFQVVPASDTGGERVVKFTGRSVDEVTLDSDARELASRRPFVHEVVGGDGLRFGLTGVYMRDGLMWLSFRVRNESRIGFTPGYVRIFIEDRKKVKRTASQDVDLPPAFAGKLPAISGRGAAVFAQGFIPFTVGKGKKLLVQLVDDGGGRSLELVIRRKVLLKARE